MQWQQHSPLQEGVSAVSAALTTAGGCKCSFSSTYHFLKRLSEVLVAQRLELCDCYTDVGIQQHLDSLSVMHAVRLAVKCARWSTMITHLAIHTFTSASSIACDCSGGGQSSGEGWVHLDVKHVVLRVPKATVAKVYRGAADGARAGWRHRGWCCDRHYVYTIPGPAVVS